MKFPLGKLVWTRGVNDLAAENAEFAEFVSACINRHANGDWGDLCDDDRFANEDALRHGGRLLSAYGSTRKIWIITEWDRSATTILFPEEY